MCSMKNKHWIQDFTWLKPTNPSCTTWLVSFTFRYTTFSYETHLESTPSSILTSSWIHTRRKWVFTQTQ